jgi:hypothetical protein
LETGELTPFKTAFEASVAFLLPLPDLAAPVKLTYQQSPFKNTALKELAKSAAAVRYSSSSSCQCLSFSQLKFPKISWLRSGIEDMEFVATEGKKGDW